MKRLSRDAWLAIGLFGVLGIITVAAAVNQAQAQKAPPLSSDSSDSDGGRALRLWLDRIGFTTNQAVSSDFGVPANTTLLLMLEPFPDLTTSDLTILDAWVENGGTLVLAGENPGMQLAAQHYGFRLMPLQKEAKGLSLQTALFTSPVLSDKVTFDTIAYLDTDRSDFVTHLAVDSHPVLVSFQKGQGRVILSASARPFSNAGLKESGNPELVLNLIAPAGPPGSAWFDEWHHGVRLENNEVVGPEQWLSKTPAGRSLLYAVVVIFLALLLQGRSFGRPVPLPAETTRRGPLEYITALANLSRRAGHRDAVLEQYRHELKRELGRRYRLDPGLPDEEYVARLAQVRPGMDAEALLSLLRRLRQPQVSESQMVQLARETAEWLKEV